MLRRAAFTVTAVLVLGGALTAQAAAPAPDTPGGHTHDCSTPPHDGWTHVDRLGQCWLGAYTAWAGASPPFPTSGSLWDSIETARKRLAAAREWASFEVPDEEAGVFNTWTNNGYPTSGPEWTALQADLTVRRQAAREAREAKRAADAAAAALWRSLNPRPEPGCGAGHNGVVERSVYFNGFHNVYGASRCR